MRSFVVVLLMMAGVGPALSAEWHQTGSQGVMHLVALDVPADYDADVFHTAVASICGTTPVCQVLFWPQGAKAPKKLPMTDAQMASQIAQWEYNANTGLRQFLWSCAKYPQVDKNDCF